MDELDKGTWTKKAPIPVAMEGLAVGVVDNKIYAVGGAEQRPGGSLVPRSSLNLMYDPASDRWHELAPLPTPLSHIGLAELDGKLYAVGGFVDIVHMGPQDLVFVYDPQSDRWSELTKLSTPKGSVSAAALDGRIHIFGGRRCDKIVRISPPGAPAMFEGFGLLSSHEIYDPANGKWEEGTPFPDPPSDHMGIAVLNGKVHLFGGRTAGFTDLVDRHDVYDPRTDTWAAARPLPRPRSDGASAVIDELIVYAGGECKPGGTPGSANTFDDVTAYDAKTDRWTALVPLPQACHGISAATVKGVAYFMGGACCCGGGASRDLYALTLGDPLANFYGNTLNIVEPQRTLKLRYRADHTFVGIDDKGLKISGTWERSGDRISMLQNPSGLSGQQPWKRSGYIGGVHKVGDRWQRTTADGATVHLSLTAGSPGDDLDPSPGHR